MSDYIIYFLLTLLFSTLFAMGGVGSAIALVPLFHMLGVPLNLSKSIGLFINSASTITASIMNFIRGVLDIKFALPLAISILLGAVIGAYISKFIDQKIIEIVLTIFLFTASILMIIPKKEAKFHYNKPWILSILGFFVGIVSGLIGVGGGSLIMPVLILLGFDAKKAAYAVSFIIPFSTLSAFLTYLSFIKMDWILLVTTAVAAIAGGYIGHYIMHFHLDSKKIKKLIAFIIFFLALKMLYKILN